MDLRRPKDEWSWEEDIPKLPEKMAHFAMEYVKHTQKIYIIGGKEKNTNYDDVNTIFLHTYIFLTF